MINDGLRLAIGTLTRMPVPPPRRLDRASVGLAMTLSPVVGVSIAALAALPILLAHRAPALGPLLAGCTVVAIAWLTRALHLDGLGDTADALGSRAPAERALQIARQSDIGPFGVIAIGAALLLQVLALGTTSVTLPAATTYWTAVVCLGGARAVIPLGCTRWFPAARPEGLGATVAGTVPRSAAVAVWLLLTAGAWFSLGTPVAAALILGGVGAVWTLGLARRRLGGITGDVLGAAVEVCGTTALVGSCLLTQLLG